MKIHFPSHCAQTKDCRRGAPVKSALASSDASTRNGLPPGVPARAGIHPGPEAAVTAPKRHRAALGDVERVFLHVFVEWVLLSVRTLDRKNPPPALVRVDRERRSASTLIKWFCILTSTSLCSVSRAAGIEGVGLQCFCPDSQPAMSSTTPLATLPGL